MPRYLLQVEDNGIIEVVPVKDEKRAIEDVLYEHTFVIYPGSIFCGRNPDQESHWEATGGGDDILITQWAEHVANAIKAECL